jgi:phosphohistidine phosphatase
VKSVLILRHAKSDWDAGYSSDHERPLARRGVRAAELIGRFLGHIDQVPDQVISSTAVRARTTAELGIEAGQWNSPALYTEALYDASVGSVLELLQQLDDSVARVLLVGHQPTWSELISALTGGATYRFPTAALARVDFEADRWDEVRTGHGSLVWLVTPRIIKGMTILS